ncbi:MAG: GIY-YIG nuclease family protein [Alphaproteobacteria bacterium]
MIRGGFVYIMANYKRGTLYIGVSSQLPRRAYQHKHNVVPGFTKRYALHDLVYFEPHEDIREAIAREKRIKRWHRAWKIELIESQNPDWRDLYPELF